MAYNYRDEKQVEVALIKKNERGDYYKITRIIPGSNKLESIDMRMMYTDDSDEIRPTKKGIRVNTEDITEFMVAVFKALSIEERQEVLEGIENLELNDKLVG